MKINIRNAKKENVPSILEIVNYEIKNSTVLYDYKERAYEFQLNWFLNKSKEKMPVIVAEKEGEILGFGTFGIFRPWDAYQHSVEHSIYVHRKSRGQGIGKLLLTELINTAKKDGFHTMIAGIDASNEKSILFHKNFGFDEIGTFKEVGYKFDKWLDLTFMQLFLK